MEQLIRDYGVLFAGLMVFAGEVGIPTGVPVEVVLLLTGSYALHSPTGLVLGVALVTSADLLGTLTLNLAVRTGGVRLLQWFVRRHRGGESERLLRWRRALLRHPVPAIFVGRLLPLLRMYITVAAGLLGVPLRVFLAGASPAALLWAGTPVVVGYVARDHVHQLAAGYAHIGRLGLLFVPLAGLVVAAVLWVRSGPSPFRLRLARLVASGLAGGGIAAYLIESTRDVDLLLEHGRGALLSPFVWLWLGVLASIGLVVLGVGLYDLYFGLQRRRGISPAVRAEVVATVIWLALLLGAGGLILSLEWRYPAL